MPYSKKIQEINGVKYANDEFSKELKRLIFKTDSDQPTFKQLKSKNIRDEKNKLINTLRVLEPNVVTDVTYESLHLFWFGIDVDLSKDQLVRDKNLEERLQNRLRRDSNISQLKQAQIVIDSQIDSLSSKKKLYNINVNYESEVHALAQIKSKTSQISTQISRLNLRKDLIQESKDELEKSKSTIDAELIKSLYERAKVLVPSIQRTFEETLAFHNGMIEKKKSFIANELPSVREELKEKQSELKLLLIEEVRLTESLEQSGMIAELEEIITQLNQFYERKGAIEEKIRQWDVSNTNLKMIDERLSEINNEHFSREGLINKRIQEFNKYFSEISSRLDGVHSILSADNVNGVYKFVIGNIEGNPGTGTKKSQMASFDLSYIKFADEKGIPCLHFILQDQIENVHSNQISNLLLQIVDEVNCQYVLSVLKDKLPAGIDTKSMTIVSLSQHDKLFRI